MPLGTEERGGPTYQFTASNESWGDPLSPPARFVCTLTDVNVDEATADTIAQEITDALSSVFDQVHASKSIPVFVPITATP